jgi:hypothetical protein
MVYCVSAHFIAATLSLVMLALTVKTHCIPILYSKLVRMTLYQRFHPKYFEEIKKGVQVKIKTCSDWGGGAWGDWA